MIHKLKVKVYLYHFQLKQTSTDLVNPKVNNKVFSESNSAELDFKELNFNDETTFVLVILKNSSIQCC